MLILNTGGTFNKRYNPLTGELFVPTDNLALEEILQSLVIDIGVQGILYKDSLEMDDTDRSLLADTIAKSDEKIIIYGRENNSGTYEFLREHVLKGEDYSPKVHSLPGTASVVNAVANDKKGIGYGGVAYSKGIKLLKVKKDDTTAGVVPELKTSKDGSYPISRYLYIYTVKKPEGAVKAFIDWVLSKEGQSVVSDVGYYPLR